MIIADQAAAPVDPCNDPARELVCPNLVMPPARRLTLSRLKDGRRLLRMDNYLVNEGPGRVTVRGHRNARYTMDAVQLIDRTRHRSPVRVDTDAVLTWKYVDDDRGNFWKFRHAARFELWRMDDQGYRVRHVATSPKLDYCLRDLFRWYDRKNVPRGPVYGPCSQKLGATTVTIGIAVGWADGYPYSYPQNWIDVTGLRGCFAIVQRADPLNHIRETDESDNTSVRVVRLPYQQRERTRCAPYTGLGVPT